MADKREGGFTAQLPFKDQTGNEPTAANLRFSSAELSFWQNRIQRAGSPEPLQDPVYYPVYALTRTEDFIQNGRRGPDGRLLHEDERAAIAPLFDSIHRIKTAYQILAHSRLDPDHRGLVDADLTRERNWHERDKVDLTDKEAMVLTALTQAADIPSDPQKRTYLHAETKQLSRK